MEPKKSGLLGKIRANPGLFQFAIRSAIFIGILFAIYLSIGLYFRHTAFFVKYLQIDE